MIASPSPSIEASVSPSPSAETSSAPTDAAEVKTIISFEAVAPEGLSVPQGTLETGLDLPASLNAQFSDGAAGEIPVTWQCAAGYDPNAEAGAQFAFAAVLPQGYAFSEGVSLPEILVTLTPTPVNTMLMAQASDEGWTLSDGKLTVTGEVYSEYFSYWNDVQSIEVTGGFFALSDGMSFSGTITVLESGYFYNYGNVSGTISVESSCYFMNNGTISGGMVSGSVYNHGTIEVVVTVDGKEKFVNYGADILETLGASPTSLWYRVNADGTRALVREGDTFASLQKEAYTSQVLLPTPKIVIDYRNESWSVTLTEEEVPEGVDVTAMDINFALSGEEYAAYADMPGLSGSWGLNRIGAFWEIDLPSIKDTTLEAYYTLQVTNEDGEVLDTVYGEPVKWVVPARGHKY